MTFYGFAYHLFLLSLCKMSTDYDRKKNIYDNKSSYIALFALLIVVACIAIYFVWSTETPAAPPQVRVVYRSAPSTQGYYDAYDQ